MYEVYRRTLNGKLRLITEFETVTGVVAGFYKVTDIVDYFGYTDIDRRRGTESIFGEGRTIHCWQAIENTSYKYVVVHKNVVVAPDRLVGEWREWKWQKHLADKKYWNRRYNIRRQGRKKQVYGGYRTVKTKQERTWAHAWDDEEFAPKVRVARTDRNLPDSWCDIRSWPTKSWKDQSNRKHQWKES